MNTDALNDSSSAAAAANSETYAVSFHSQEQYVDFIRDLIKNSAPPKSWISLENFQKVLDEKRVEPYFKKMGFPSLEHFLIEPAYRELWRVDNQPNTPFLIRHSYGREIKIYIETIREAIVSLYYANNHRFITLEQLANRITASELPISYRDMGFPSFEVFLFDKRFESLWHATKTEDFLITLEPHFVDKELFLDKAYRAVERYFRGHKHKPSAHRLAKFFDNGPASKMLSRFGYESSLALAKDPVFESLINSNTSSDEELAQSQEQTSPLEIEENIVELAKLIDSIYSSVYEDSEWISLTSIASRIPNVRERVKKINYPNLSAYIIENAERFRWEYRYTNHTPPVFQMRLSVLPRTANRSNAHISVTEEQFINEVNDKIRQICEGSNDWVLLAILGQYIPNVKQKLESLGFSSLGGFVKEKSKVAGRTFKYIDNLPSKLAIRITADEEVITADEEAVPENTNYNVAESQEYIYVLDIEQCKNLVCSTEKLKEIAQLAVDEDWDMPEYSDQPYAVLNYLLQSALTRSVYCNALLIEGEQYIFNTNLATGEGNAILAVVETSVHSETNEPIIQLVESRVANAVDCITGQTAPRFVQYFFASQVTVDKLMYNPYSAVPFVDWNKLNKGFSLTNDELDKSFRNSLLILRRQCRFALPCYDKASNDINLLLPLFANASDLTPFAVLELNFRNNIYAPVALCSVQEAYVKARTLSPLEPFI